MRTHDVIVVGGGPAGSAPAILLAQQGFDVVVLDRARFPRDKPCGEFLTPEAVRILGRMGCWDSIRPLGAVPIQSITLNAPNGRQTAYEPGVAGWSIRRTVLDAALLDFAAGAGAQVQEGVAARGLCRDTCGTVVGVRTDSGEIRGTLVIGADGTHSRVARELGLVRPIRRLQRIALVSHWRDVSVNGLEMRCRNGIACGFSPVAPNEANLTLVAPLLEGSRIAGRRRDYLAETTAALFPEIHSRLASTNPEVRVTGCFGHMCRRASAPGALLVGDAAAFIDPFTGEGIYFALRGAELAAETADAALRSGDVSARALARYDRARSELSARYRLCDAVQAVVRTPFLMNRAVDALSRSSQLKNRLMRVMGDEAPPSGVINPRFAAALFM